MGPSFFDFNDGDFCFSLSDQMGMDSDGHLMMRMSDGIAMDLDSGDIHITSSWPSDTEEDF